MFAIYLASSLLMGWYHNTGLTDTSRLLSFAWPLPPPLLCSCQGLYPFRACVCPVLPCEYSRTVQGCVCSDQDALFVILQSRCRHGTLMIGSRLPLSRGRPFLGSASIFPPRVPNPAVSLSSRMDTYYRFLTLGRGLHSSAWTGCSMTLVGYPGVLPWYPFDQSYDTA